MTDRSPGAPALRHATVETALGRLTVVVDQGAAGGEVVVGIYFPGHWTDPDQSAWGPAVEPDGLILRCRDELDAYAAGTRTDFTVPYELRGNDLQQRVWAELLTIPRGSTISYGELARRVGVANAQLVGQAVGHNPISVVVPCHRVVGADGGLTGYAGGVDRKVFLLELEGAREPGLFPVDRFEQG